MNKIYITRHGETEWNVQNRLQGQIDTSLTDRGILNTLKLKEQILELSFEVVYSSPLKRAVQTAELLVPNRINQDDRIKEISLGQWEGKTYQKIKSENPIQHYYYWHSPQHFFVENGETFEQVIQRVESFIRDLRKHNGNVLIVTHGVIIQVLLMLLDNRPLSSLRDLPILENNGLVVLQPFELEGKV